MSVRNKRLITLIKVIFFYAIALISTILLALIWQSTSFPQEFQIPQLGPGITAGIFVFIINDEDINRSEFPNSQKKPKKWHYFILFEIVVLTGLITYLIAFAINKIDKVQPINNLELYLAWIIFGSIGEELGWRSYLQRMLEKNFQSWFAYVIVGFTWGLWHIQYFRNGITFMLGFMVFTISSSVAIGEYSKKYGNNLMFATIFHCGINLCYAIFLAPALTNPLVITIFGSIWGIIALFVVIIMKFSKRIEGSNPNRTEKTEVRVGKMEL